MEQSKKFREAIANLEAALRYRGKAKSDPVFYAAVTKSFEVCFEYAWRYFKMQAQEEGLEVFSPRECVKAAGRLGIIDDVETWMEDLENRNLSVHDYLGISKTEYLQAISNFLVRVKRVMKVSSPRKKK